MSKTRPAPARTVIGLMSGTSTDGISAALVRLQPQDGRYRHRLIAFRTLPYPAAVRTALLRIAEGEAVTAEALARLHVQLGERLAAAAASIARRSGLSLRRVDLIGSHGHTVFHGPPVKGDRRPPATLQIGEPAVIAARTGITTVADFRPADVALGGQGAPLVPYVHWLLFTDASQGRAIHNLGGIANLTYLPPGGELDRVLAFDTGPGNMVIDAVVGELTRGRARFDRDGAMAARGHSHEPTLRQLLSHPYFNRRPPKSTGREEFGEAFVGRLMKLARRARLAPEDVIATATALTAESVAAAYRRFVRRRGHLDEIYLAGGGARNPTLAAMIARRLPEVRLGHLEDLGVPSEAIESISFAVLACEALRGVPANVPAVTGAKRPAVLGKIVPGRAEQWRRLTSTRSRS